MSEVTQKGDNTMNLRPIKANMTEVQINDDLTVLFSYKAPVACSIVLDGKWHYFKTEKFWSVTTSRHINQWLPVPTGTQPQEYFDNLLANVNLMSEVK